MDIKDKDLDIVERALGRSVGYLNKEIFKVEGIHEITEKKLKEELEEVEEVRARISKERDIRKKLNEIKPVEME